jgi:hypothetical protein
LPFDPDAHWGHWGHRTRTYSNKTTKCFGYDVFAVTAMPKTLGAVLERPLLTERLVVTPASADVVAPALGIFDRLTADRAWSYKLAERWADELRARGIEAVLDLHANNYGVRDADGIRIVAGAPHCPSLPDDLVDIRQPAQLSVGPGRPRMSGVKKAERAKRETELTEFSTKIAEPTHPAWRPAFYRQPLLPGEPATQTPPPAWTSVWEWT